jgi:hypothetical protein
VLLASKIQLETAHRLLGLENKVKGRKADLMNIGTTVKHFRREIIRHNI